MTDRERVLRTFEHQPIDRMVWQPRLEHWYHVNKAQGTLPDRHKNLTLTQVYDDLGCSIRGYHLFNGCFRSECNPEVKVRKEKAANGERIWWDTPAGTVTAFERSTELSHLRGEFPIKSIQDLPVLEHLIRRGRVWFDEEKYKAMDAELGERAQPTAYMPRVPFMQLVIDYMGFQGTIFAIHDQPDEMARIIQLMEDEDDAYYEAVLLSPIRIINFGDNLHCDLFSPALFERFILPHYLKRSAQLGAAGKFTHAHWDGDVRSILKYTRKTGLNGYEALTPKPQGDVTLEQIRDALGDDLILLDGVPCTHFLPNVPERELTDCVNRIMELFPAKNVVLGISDEISPPGDIERVRFVSELLAQSARK